MEFGTEGLPKMTSTFIKIAKVREDISTTGLGEIENISTHILISKT
jgi:hypothetical protein